MKCVCGYEYEEDWDYSTKPAKRTIAKGDKPFIRLNLSNQITVTKDNPEIMEPWRTAETVGLHVCPKCGTVRISDY